MQQTQSHQPIRILLVEDNPGDVRLTIEAFNDAKLNNALSVVRDGVEAMAFLRQEGEFAEAQLPDLILLDLNLPRKDGREVLAETTADPDLQSIPVVVLTTSETEEDIVKSYTKGAACYVTKPVSLEEFQKVVRCIEEFRFTVVKLPPR